MTPTTRYLCPLDCGWHHDETDADFSDPNVTHPFVEQSWASGIDGFVAGLAAGRAAVVEAAVKAHLETHPLIEWVQALMKAREERGAAPACMCTEFVDQIDHPDEAALDAVDAAMGSPDLTREELQDLVDEQGTDLYKARDLLAFVREMCDQRDAAGTPVTTADVRNWLGYTGCGGVLVLPDEVVAALATMPGEPPDKAATSSDVTDIAGEQ